MASFLGTANTMRTAPARVNLATELVLGILKKLEKKFYLEGPTGGWSGLSRALFCQVLLILTWLPSVALVPQVLQEWCRYLTVGMFHQLGQNQPIIANPNSPKLQKLKTCDCLP